MKQKNNIPKKEIKKKGNKEVITEAQAKRLFMLAKGKDTAKVKEIIVRYGFKESKDIAKSKYNAICDEIEKL